MITRTSSPKVTGEGSFRHIGDKKRKQKSTIVCSQRSPSSWTSMILNDEVSSNSVVKRVTKHFTVLINVPKEKQ